MSRPFKNKDEQNARRETLEGMVATMDVKTAAVILQFINNIKRKKKEEKKRKYLDEYKKRLTQNAPRTYPF